MVNVDETKKQKKELKIHLLYRKYDANKNNGAFHTYIQS